MFSCAIFKIFRSGIRSGTCLFRFPLSPEVLTIASKNSSAKRLSPYEKSIVLRFPIQIMDGSEMPKCEKCKKRRKMSKKFSIEKYPQLLVIHLKRFGDSTGFSRRKITADIRFPEMMAMDGNKYELQSVCNHFGSSKNFCSGFFH